MTVDASVAGGTSLNIPPKPPTAVRRGSQITASRMAKSRPQNTRAPRAASTRGGRGVDELAHARFEQRQQRGLALLGDPAGAHRAFERVPSGGHERRDEAGFRAAVCACDLGEGLPGFELCAQLLRRDADVPGDARAPAGETTPCSARAACARDLGLDSLRE